MPFITPYYNCKLFAYFQITEQALIKLRLEGVSSSVLERLVSMKDQAVKRKGKFLDTLKTTIGDTQTARYRSLILKHAKISDTKTYTVDVTLSAPPQKSPSPVIKLLNNKLDDLIKIYKITNQSLKKLKSEGVPKDVLEKLERKKNQEIKRERKFLDVLKDMIGSKQTSRYKTLILKHTKCFNDKNFKNICDFGTGKLRNAEPFLKSGFTVYAVEYEEQFQYNASAKMLKFLQKKYPKRFKKLIFPSAFEASKVEFDAVLLIFVIHTIPSPEDRNLIIKICSEKLRKGGLLIWVTPYGDTNMRRLCKDQYAYKDGWILHAGTGTSRKTFYTEFRVPQIEDMMERHGLTFIERLDFFKNPARVYER